MRQTEPALPSKNRHDLNEVPSQQIRTQTTLSRSHKSISGSGYLLPAQYTPDADALRGPRMIH